MKNKIFFYVKKYSDLLTVIVQRGYLKHVLIAQDVKYISGDLTLKYPENLTLGKNVRIGRKVTIGALAKIEIGNNVTLSQGVLLETAGLDLKSKDRQHKAAQIVIGDNAWIGANAVVLAGVTIGEDAVIGAGTVVRKDIAKGDIFTG